MRFGTRHTDGNHGRAVAWGAREFGATAVILIHAHVSEERKRAIEAYGAKVVRVDGNYDDSVRAAQSLADENGWTVVSDTSYDGYEDIPGLVMQGYTMMAHEAVTQMAVEDARPSHVFLQCGVGGLAAAVIAQTAELLAPDLPRYVAVEPVQAACVLARLPGHEEIVTRLRRTVAARLRDGEPDIGTVSRALRCTPRTLQRRLKGAGTSFRKELNLVRNELALSYLRDPALQITDVAMLLGYSEHSAFTRAFRRQNGTTPQRLRDRVRG